MYRRISIRDDINQQNRHIIGLADRDGGRVRGRTTSGDARRMTSVGDLLTADNVSQWDTAREAELGEPDPMFVAFQKANDGLTRNRLRRELDGVFARLEGDLEPDDEDQDEETDDEAAHQSIGEVEREAVERDRKTARAGDHRGVSGRNRWLANTAHDSRGHRPTVATGNHHQHVTKGGGSGLSGRNLYLSRGAADSRAHRPTTASGSSTHQKESGGGAR